ncbi:MAG: hypothetical protein ACE5OR_13640, partial [bacterium]
MRGHEKGGEGIGKAEESRIWQKKALEGRRREGREGRERRLRGDEKAKNWREVKDKRPEAKYSCALWKARLH